MLRTIGKLHSSQILNKNSNRVTIQINDMQESWKILLVNKFTSERKMMSIVLQRESDNLIVSYLKGADTVIHIQNSQLLDTLESYGG